jgi:predicted metal-dependent hydrolase
MGPLEAALPVPIEVRRVRSAKRLRLRFDEVSGTLKLTCPWRSSRRKALAWALDQRQWIERQLARAEPGEPFVDGARFPLDGKDMVIRWDERAPRTPVLSDGVLHCGGPANGVSRRVEQFLRKLALERLSADVAEFTAAAGVSAKGITIGDAASRWGSCSSRDTIRFSWRLILAPTNVRRYVAAHEVAHLVHLNHGAEFKALEARLYGVGIAAAKAELRRLGPRLRRIGRG